MIQLETVVYVNNTTDKEEKHEVIVSRLNH